MKKERLYDICVLSMWAIAFVLVITGGYMTLHNNVGLGIFNVSCGVLLLLLSEELIDYVEK